MREIDREMRAASKCRAREHNDRAWLAWHIVALDRTNRLPKLETLLVSLQVRRKQTQEEMAATLKTIFIAFGGDPAELKNNAHS